MHSHTHLHANTLNSKSYQKAADWLAYAHVSCCVTYEMASVKGIVIAHEVWRMSPFKKLFKQQIRHLTIKINVYKKADKYICLTDVGFKITLYKWCVKNDFKINDLKKQIDLIISVFCQHFLMLSVWKLFKNVEPIPRHFICRWN